MHCLFRYILLSEGKGGEKELWMGEWVVFQSSRGFWGVVHMSKMCQKLKWSIKLILYLKSTIQIESLEKLTSEKNEFFQTIVFNVNYKKRLRNWNSTKNDLICILKLVGSKSNFSLLQQFYWDDESKIERHYYEQEAIPKKTLRFNYRSIPENL